MITTSSPLSVSASASPPSGVTVTLLTPAPVLTVRITARDATSMITTPSEFPTSTWVPSGVTVTPFVPAPVFNQEGGTVLAGFQITLTGPTNKTRFFYTLDGGDPRLPKGALNPSAREYAGSLPITGRVRVLARARRGEDWSPKAEAVFEVKER